jgi:hypothetical protein
MRKPGQILHRGDGHERVGGAPYRCHFGQRAPRGCAGAGRGHCGQRSVCGVSQSLLQEVEQVPEPLPWPSAVHKLSAAKAGLTPGAALVSAPLPATAATLQVGAAAHITVDLVAAPWVGAFVVATALAVRAAAVPATQLLIGVATRAESVPIALAVVVLGHLGPQNLSESSPAQDGVTQTSGGWQQSSNPHGLSQMQSWTPSWPHFL